MKMSTWDVSSKRSSHLLFRSRDSCSVDILRDRPQNDNKGYEIPDGREFHALTANVESKATPRYKLQANA